MQSAEVLTPSKRRISKRKLRDTGFYIALIAIPMLQFIIFYICVNFNSILLAFKEYQTTGGVDAPSTYIWVGLRNFKDAFTTITASEIFGYAIRNSLVYYVVSLVIGVPLALVFSYYFYKKMPGSKFLHVIVFMPSIISSLVLSIIFRSITEDVFSDIFTSIESGLLSEPNTAFATVIFYNIWVGFGMSVLLYSSQMSSIDESLSEAAKLDGAGQFKEFWHVSLPLTFPTITTFLIVGVAGIFTNNLSLLGLYHQAPAYVQSVGYYLYMKTLGATESISELPKLSAMGLLFTLVAVPITLIVKYLLEKFGPSAN